MATNAEIVSTVGSAQGRTLPALFPPGLPEPGGERLRSAAEGTGPGEVPSGWRQGSWAMGASRCRQPRSPARWYRG